MPGSRKQSLPSGIGISMPDSRKQSSLNEAGLE